MLTADPPTTIEPSAPPAPPPAGERAARPLRLPWMRSVFWRIFLFFWLGTVVLAGAMTFTVYLTDPDQFFPRLNSVPLRMIDQWGEEGVGLLRNGGSEALRRYLTALPADPALRQPTGRARYDGAYLFDIGSGQELSGRPVPPGAAEIVRHASHSPDLQLERLPHKLLMAREVGAESTPSKQRFAFVLTMPRTSVFLPSVMQSWLYVGTALLVSGLVCYSLARYVIQPVRNLQGATRKLASGDLTARVLTNRGLARRRDEFSELAADFDNMAAQIENLLTVQRQLVGDISHELGSPLTRVNVALGLAYRKANPEVRPELERIEREARRLNELVRQLLLVSELESSRERPPSMESVNLEDLVREVASDAEFEAGNRQCRVSVNVLADALSAAPGLLTHGSRHLLHSAVENIVRNAIRYTAEGSEVAIELLRKAGGPGGGPTIVIRVLDQGPGVPPEALPNLFQPFFRVSEARDRLSGGTGLGLAITKQAVKAHGGRVAASNHPDGGFQVEIELPGNGDGPTPPGLQRRASAISAVSLRPLNRIPSVFHG